MTLEQLKASAYDALAQINNWQAKLAELNNQISNFKEDEQVEKSTEEKPKDEVSS